MISTGIGNLLKTQEQQSVQVTNSQHHYIPNFVVMGEQRIKTGASIVKHDKVLILEYEIYSPDFGVVTSAEVTPLEKGFGPSDKRKRCVLKCTKK